MDITAAADYCRQVEAYLCRKNDGHLVRIVGPAFEQVCAWASRGVPLKVTCRGIDRYFERYYAKGARRRPVRIEFCEADVLDVFDEWRRAVGIGSLAPAAEAGTSNGGADPNAGADIQGGQGLSRQPSLPAHLERVVARLTALRGGQERSLDETIDAIVRELDAARATAKTLRGDARERLLARLRELDARLLDAARAGYDDSALQQCGADADAELAPFRDRMPQAAYEQSRAACIDRLIRERARLPTIGLE